MTVVVADQAAAIQRFSTIHNVDVRSLEFRGTLTSSMNSEKLRHHFWPGMMAIIFSTLGWLGMPDRPVIYADAIPGVKIVEALFAMPRGISRRDARDAIFSARCSRSGRIRLDRLDG